MTKSSDVNAALYYLGIAALIAVGFLAGCKTSAKFHSVDFYQSVVGNQTFTY